MMRSWPFGLIITLGTWLATLGLVGCATSDSPLEGHGGPVEKVFDAPYDQVWRATQLAMARYPRKIDDIEAGVLETETLKGDQGWTPPFLKDRRSSGYRQSLHVHLIKGDEEGVPAVKVVVLKQAELVRSFFAEPEKLESDGLEERMIMYRVERELKIDQAIQRSIKKKSSSQFHQNDERPTISANTLSCKPPVLAVAPSAAVSVAQVLQ